MKSGIQRLALVSTDDEKLGQLLCALLAPIGFKVSLIRSGASRSLNIDDFSLLVIDGDPKWPIEGIAPAVVVISPSNPVTVYDAGADLVINKPLESNIFMARIRSILRRYGIQM